MNFAKFLEAAGCDKSDIRELIGDEAMEAVKNNGYALQYVKKQTEAVRLEAAKNNGDALQYVKKSVFIVSAKPTQTEVL
jgi:hypothetical protein